MLAEVIRLLVTLALAVSGAYLAKNYPPDYVSQNFALILFIIIGAGLGYVVGGAIGRALARLTRLVENKARKIPSFELLAGIGGLVLGLIVASLISKPVEALLKPLGHAKPYAITIVYFVLGYLGFTLFVKRQFNFDMGDSPGSADTGVTDNILDTSVIIDGRIADVIEAGFIQGKVIIPRFVLAELQTIADSADDLRRTRGRRGLDVLQQLRKQTKAKVELLDQDFPGLSQVDDKLIKVCREKQANLITNDYNLGKIAILDGINVLNLNDLAKTLKPVVLAGEHLFIAIIKEGKEKEQGVGYLDDGTMVVIENGRKHIGETAEVIVNSILQTSAGKLVFTKLK